MSMLNTSIHRARWTVCAVALLGLPLCAVAAGQRAEIGRGAPNGDVSLHMERFHGTFEDGTKVTEIGVKSVGGYLQLVRKGFVSGACRQQATPIVDAAGAPVLAGGAPPGQSLFIRSVYPVALTRCADDGCHATKWIVPIGGEPLAFARCDITEESDNKCACHQGQAGGTNIVPEGRFCRSTLTRIPLDLGDWIWVSYIQPDYE
jgi:hypothetical protein